MGAKLHGLISINGNKVKRGEDCVGGSLRSKVEAREHDRGSVVCSKRHAINCQARLHNKRVYTKHATYNTSTYM